MEGVIKFYNSKDAVGIVTASDGKDYFFQRSSLVRKDNKLPILYCGDKVQFSLTDAGLVGKHIVKDGTLVLLEKSAFHTTVLENNRQV